MRWMGIVASLLLACSSNNGPTAGGDSGMTDAPAPDVGEIVEGEFAGLRVSDGVTTWRFDGSGVDGGDALASVPGHNAFWFAWSIFNPGTELFGDSTIRDAEIVGDGECGVPCDEIIPGCPGRDCIPPLDSPRFVPAGDPSLDYLSNNDLVMGVVTSEGPRAYPHNILWWHEVINEEVGDEAFTITLCPLTGSGLRFNRRGFVDGETVRLGVSGLLYNSNLVMWDRETETLWSQMRLEAVQGDNLGSASPIEGVLEMTWAAWVDLYPDTLVVSGDTGHSRDYTRYPYTRGGDYRFNHADTFRNTNPEPDPQFQNKDMVFGITRGAERRGYVWSDLAEAVGSRRGVVNDDLGGTPIAIVFDLDAQYVHAFERPGDEISLVE